MTDKIDRSISDRYGKALEKARRVKDVDFQAQIESRPTTMMTDWQPIETAPRDGTPIQAKIPGHGENNIIAFLTAIAMDSDGNDCGGWAFFGDQEPPECWTDGVCWAVNEDGKQSASPTHWKPITLPEKADE